MSLCKGFTQGGSNADIVLADSYLKNVTEGVDWVTGYEAVVADAEGTFKLRIGYDHPLNCRLEEPLDVRITSSSDLHHLPTSDTLRRVTRTQLSLGNLFLL